MRGHQYQFSDGLRGLAAIQVVLLHYASVFLPVFAHEGSTPAYQAEQWLSKSPLFFLIDGGTAVCIFFAISGFVLASSFQKSPIKVLPAIARRTTRLFVPVAIAACFAWALLSLMPGYGARIASITHSDFSARLYQEPMNVLGLLRDVVANSLFIGYKATSIFDSFGWMPVAQPSASTNPPFWTLHIEFWGSMLVLGLAYLRQRLPRALFVMALAVSVLIVGTSWYALFLLGFVLNLLNRKLQTTSFIASVLGVAAVLWGVFVGYSKGSQPINDLYLFLNGFVVGKAFNPFTFQSTAAGALIFTGVLLNGPMRRCLASRPCTFLGRLSFGMYLLHFPVLFTVGAIIFLRTLSHGYSVAMVAATVVGVVTTGALAYAFDRWIDRRAIQLSHSVSDALSVPEKDSGIERGLT